MALQVEQLVGQDGVVVEALVVAPAEIDGSAFQLNRADRQRQVLELDIARDLRLPLLDPVFGECLPTAWADGRQRNRIDNRHKTHDNHGNMAGNALS